MYINIYMYSHTNIHIYMYIYIYIHIYIHICIKFILSSICKHFAALQHTATFQRTLQWICRKFVLRTHFPQVRNTLQQIASHRNGPASFSACPAFSANRPTFSRAFPDPTLRSMSFRLHTCVCVCT